MEHCHLIISGPQRKYFFKNLSRKLGKPKRILRRKFEVSFFLVGKGGVEMGPFEASQGAKDEDVFQVRKRARYITEYSID